MLNEHDVHAIFFITFAAVLITAMITIALRVE